MELDDRLAAARARRDAALKSLMGKHVGGEWEECHAAEQALLAIERERAAAYGEQHAVPLNFPVRWDAGAPLPQLLVNDHRALLVFVVKVPDPAWDGTYATIQSASSEEPRSLALVELERCIAAKLGSPNDEACAGHPLAGRGMEPYTAQIVMRSKWIAELQSINSVHLGYRAEHWERRKHYVFWFHDTTFECVADGFTVERYQCSMPQLLAEAARRMIAD